MTSPSRAADAAVYAAGDPAVYAAADPAVDLALREALGNADPHPGRVTFPYTAPIRLRAFALRQCLPGPVTAMRWAGCTAVCSLVVGSVAYVLDAMGEPPGPRPDSVSVAVAPPAVAPPGLRPPDGDCLAYAPSGLRRPGDCLANARPSNPDAPASAPAAPTERAAPAAPAVSRAAAGGGDAVSIVGVVPSAHGRTPVVLAADAGVATVSVDTPTGYQPRHAAPDVELNLLGLRVALELA